MAGSTAPPPRGARPGPPPNRTEQVPFDRRQGSFRPPRPYLPPPPTTSHGPYNSQWVNAPPRMQLPYGGSNFAPFAMNGMRGALDGIDHGYHPPPAHIQQGPSAPSMYSVRDGFPPREYQPYPPPPFSMQRLQQYPSNMDHMRPTLPIEQPFPPQYPTSNPQFYPPHFVQQHPYNGHSDAPSFVHPANGQYYANDHGPAGPHRGYPSAGALPGNQHWGN